MRSSDEIGIVVDRAIGRRILNKRAEKRVVEVEPRIIADLYLDPERFRPGLNHGSCLGMTIISYKELLPIGNYRVTKRHRFGSSSRFVQHGSVRDVESGQIDNHLLKVQQRFEPPLRDFR